MADHKPTLEYAKPSVLTRRWRLPWGIDIPLVILTASAVLFGLALLSRLLTAVLVGFAPP